MRAIRVQMIADPEGIWNEEIYGMESVLRPIAARKNVYETLGIGVSKYTLMRLSL